MSVGKSVAVINYISQVFSPIENLGMEIQTIQSAVAGVYGSSFYEFLAKPERDIRPASTAPRSTYFPGQKSSRPRMSTTLQSSTMIVEERALVDSRHTVGKNGAVQELENAQGRAENSSGDTSAASIDLDAAKVNDSGIFENTEPCVEFKDVTFGYDDHIVLNDMNFAIYPGEQVTLTGRTGAGKSTIFKLLLGLYRPNSGEALIEGEAAYRLSDKEKRKKFGYVEQSFHMVPGTVRDQITLFDPAIGDEAVQAAAKLVGLHGTIVSLDDGYDTLCKPEIFSQGQWQLLSIARAVAGKPGILLLDEITANLDAETEEMVLRALKSASEGRTVISISHRVYQKDGTGRLIGYSSCKA